MPKDPRVARFAHDLSNPMAIAATTSGELRHGSVSGTLDFPQLARAAGEGDFVFDYRSVAVANIGLANVCGHSTAKRASVGSSNLSVTRLTMPWTSSSPAFRPEAVLCPGRWWEPGAALGPSRPFGRARPRRRYPLL